MTGLQNELRQVIYPSSASTSPYKMDTDSEFQKEMQPRKFMHIFRSSEEDI